jgi:DNA polymerase-3 subunit beta
MLKVRCDRDELAEACSAILSIVPTLQPLKPILLNFHFFTQGGRLFLEATDLDIGARIGLERVEVLEDGALALPAQRFSSLVREVPQKEIVLEAEGEGASAAIVRAESFEFRLIGEDPGEFPALPTLNQEEALSTPREKFLEMLRRVAIAASRDPARYQLTGVFVEVDGDKMVMTATDGKRLTNDYIRIENPSGFAKRGIVPNRAVDALLKVLPKGDMDFGFSMGESELHVAFGSGELTSKLIEGTYPDYKVAVSQKMEVKVTGKRTDFLAAARSAALMTDKETATVIFHFEEGRACMTTQARDIGESRIEIPISLQGEPIDIRFNPTYFIDALRCVLEEEIRLEFLDGAKPGSIRGSQHYRHMLMPLVVATA